MSTPANSLRGKGSRHSRPGFHVVRGVRPRCLLSADADDQDCCSVHAGQPDIMARLLAEEINRAQGPTMVVENRPGGSAAIGTEAVARAAPDGSTLLIATTAFVISPHLRKLSYDPLTSFEPICNRPPSLSSAAHPPTSRSPICLARGAHSPAS
jgi:hypothetical protein